MKYAALLLLIIVLIVGCSTTKTSKVLPVNDQFKFAMDLYDNGKYLKAQTAFENLIYTYPGNAVIDTAQFYLGMCYYQRKDYGLASGEFKRVLTAYPNSGFADDSQYYIAMSHYKLSPKYSLDQGETNQAIYEFNLLTSTYISSPFVKEARQRVAELTDKLAEKKFKAGELYLKIGYYDAALTYFSYVRDNYPSTNWAIMAYYYSGEAQLKLKKYDEAEHIFDTFIVGFPDNELVPEAKKNLEKLKKIVAGDES